jgi:hypothetical protein
MFAEAAFLIKASACLGEELVDVKELAVFIAYEQQPPGR